MASLVAPLVSGISTAASGSVEFFQEGTSTLAHVFSDADGETEVTSHVLDSRGGIVRYVNERVTVRVLDSDGAEVLSFVWGTDAREVRLENEGFTGPDEDGQIVGGGRTTVDAAFTSLFESLGATDGQVMVNGEEMSLADALSGSAGLVYNVKSVYGAVGDGVHDDGPNIQAAINAADAAGGGILYFPHGTYKISTAVTVANSTGKFFFLGESATGTKLKQGTSGITMLSLGNGNQPLLQALTFTATAANTGALVAVGTTARATFVSCTFEPLNGTTLALSAAATSQANLFGCSISQAGASSRIASGNSAYLRLIGCDITTSGGDLTSFSDALFVISSGTNWKLGAAGSAGTTYILNNGSGLLHVIGGEIDSDFTSGTVTVVPAGGLQMAGVILTGSTLSAAGASATLIESACSFTASASIGASVSGYSGARDHSVLATTNSATSFTPSGAFGIHEYTSDGGSMAFNNPSPSVPTGSLLIIVYKNNTSGGGAANITPTFGTAYSITPVVVNSGNSQVYVFLKLGTITSDLVLINTQVTNGVTL